ncbi:MAG: uroporphyrinogen decarboxylase [Acidobacteriota bacterium]
MTTSHSHEGLGGRARFLAAIAGEPVDRPPVWIMRQAGRYLPEYRELRERTPFLERVRNPELAVEITLQPLRRFPLDAAIVFSDILIVLEALGHEVVFPPGGPRVTPALKDSDGPSSGPGVASLEYLPEALRRLRPELGDDRALLGFAGAPFTLACYAIEGGGSKDFASVRQLMLTEPDRFQDLLGRIADMVSELLLMQLEAGADLVQLFDTWAETLSLDDYRQHVAPHVKTIIDRVHAASGKITLFQRGGTHLLPAALESGADCLSLDWRVDVAEAARQAEGRCALQGNLDPAALFAGPEEIERRVKNIHEAVGGRTGHVFNLGHGVLPPTPIDGVASFVEAVGRLGSS